MSRHGARAPGALFALGLSLALLAVSGSAESRPRRRRPAVRPERWSVVLGGGLEAVPDSVGAGLSPLGQLGLGGTVRVSRWTCFDVRFTAGATEDGSDTTRVSETRLRLDARPAYCPALDRLFTAVLGVGPATQLSLHEARVRDQRTRYSAFDVGLVADAGGMLRLGPFVLRCDLEVGVLRRLVLGAFAALGVAL